MFERSPKYVLVPLTLLLAASIACDRTTASPTTPAPGAGALKLSFTAEPLVVRPEFLPGSSCTSRPSFGVRITVVLGSGEDVILRGLRFSFTDRFGERALPDVFPTPEGSFIPSSPPVPFPGVASLPTRGPIPIPGSPPIDGVLVSALTSRELPFFLRFGCGVFPDGTLLIDGDLNDRNGRPDRAEMRVVVRP
jgi:hypothetical protein